MTNIINIIELFNNGTSQYTSSTRYILIGKKKATEEIFQLTGDLLFEEVVNELPKYKELCLRGGLEYKIIAVYQRYSFHPIKEQVFLI
jgi:hypothetical protein